MNAIVFFKRLGGRHTGTTIVYVKQTFCGIHNFNKSVFPKGRFLYNDIDLNLLLSELNTKYKLSLSLRKRVPHRSY